MGDAAVGAAASAEKAANQANQAAAASAEKAANQAKQAVFRAQSATKEIKRYMPKVKPENKQDFIDLMVFAVGKLGYEENAEVLKQELTS